ncbi:hypothetical protein HN695_01085, partial [Candidatus Woesearchaeota archaeon]|nr:hypothetical protein [Candidatus Woesearchaeota archaeon]
VIALAVGFFALRDSDDRLEVLDEEKDEQTSFSADKVSFQNYFDECAKQGILTANQEIGIDKENEAYYEEFVTTNINVCMNDFLSRLEERGFNINKQDTNVDLQVHDEIVQLLISYPVEVSDEASKFTFNEYESTLSRTQTIQLEGGVASEEVVILSTDKNTKLTIPEGTTVVDENGNPVEEISVKILEKHFDGLVNSVVIGNLVYEGLPDGAHFSKPIEISMKIAPKDVPEFMDESYLSIAYWDGILWQALPTEVLNEGVLITNVDHFTAFAVATCAAEGAEGDQELSIITPLLFQQEFGYQFESEGEEEEPSNDLPSDVEDLKPTESRDSFEKEPQTPQFDFLYTDDGHFGLTELNQILMSYLLEAYNARLNRQSPGGGGSEPLWNGFCEPIPKNAFWKEDRDAIVPNAEEFVKVILVEDERIIRTMSEVPDEIRQFGVDEPELCNQPTEEKKPAKVTPYCCCTPSLDGYKCYDEVMGEQECIEALQAGGWVDLKAEGLTNVILFTEDGNTIEEHLILDSTYDEKTQIYTDGEFNNGNAIIKNTNSGDEITCQKLFDDETFETTETTNQEYIEREVFGYNTDDCIDGELHDGDLVHWNSATSSRSTAVYEIRFKGGEGNECFDTSTVEYINDKGETCDDMPNALRKPPILVEYPDQAFSGEKTYAYLLNDPIVSYAGDSMCTDCSAKITLYAKGNWRFSGLSETYQGCDDNQEGMFDIIYNQEGKPECRLCKLTTNMPGGLPDSFTYEFRESGFCDIGTGCGECLSYPQAADPSGIAGVCPKSLDGDWFCHTDEVFYQCNYNFDNKVGQLTPYEIYTESGEYTSRFKENCLPCLEHPSTSTDCVQI